MKKFIKGKRLLEEELKKLRRKRLWLFLKQEQLKQEKIRFKTSIKFNGQNL